MAKTSNILIKKTEPSHNATGVPLSSTIEIVFNEDMLASSLTNQTVSLLIGGKQVTGAYQWVGMTKTLKITPAESLSPSSTYQLLVKSLEEGPKTLLGTQLANPHNAYFTTEAKEDEEEEVVPPDENIPEVPDITGSFFLMDSYPADESFVRSVEEIVLAFNLEVGTGENLSHIQLKEKAISPLLERTGGKIIPVQLKESTVDGVLVLEPGMPLRKGAEHQLLIGKDFSSTNNERLGENQYITFQTQWERFYTEVSEVRLLLGIFADMYSDIEIARMIHQQSNGLYQLMSMHPTFDPDAWDEEVPYAASYYVLYRTAYQGMLGQIIESSSGMKTSFQLGDLSVSDSSTTSSEITDLLKLFQDEIDRWWKLLNGIEETVDGEYKPKLVREYNSATRGGDVSAYPNFLTRVPFTDLGG